MDSAAPCRITLCTCVSELSDKLLQKFYIGVGEDRGYQFAFFIVRSRNADILLEFPLPAVCIPG